MRYFTLVLLLCIANIGLGQVSSFPNSESFETVFTTGTNISFISNWTGNKVASSNRIFQGTNPRTGSSSLNIIPTSTFQAEILISLDLTGISNLRIQFHAYSIQNGSTSSTRPALLSFGTSIDDGSTYLDDTGIGDDSTFPNDNNTSYSLYSYDLPASAANQEKVVIKIGVVRGAGSGSAAELIMDDFTYEEQVIPLAISSVSASSRTSVLIIFNQEITEATAEMVNNYAIDNGITVSNASHTSANQVTLTVSPMPNNNYQVTVNNVRDAATGTPALDLQENFSSITPLSIDSTNIVNKNTIELFFNLDLNKSSAEDVSNYSLDNGIGNPGTVELDPGNNKKVTLTLNTDFLNNTYEVTVNSVTDASTLASAINLASSATYLPLGISNLSALSNTRIKVTFNQDVASNQANTTANYALDFGYGNPSSAMQDGGDASVVILNYASGFVNNTYKLTIDNVSNLSGNTTASMLQSSFANNTATGNRHIVINEIFADPTGASPPAPLVLPSETTDEYIELYNASSNAIDIGGFNMAGGTVGTFVLQPDSYVILTSTSNVSEFQSFGDVVTVTSWNTLTNGGEQLQLRDNLGNLIDSLTYDSNWFNDVAKSDGAWSIEQINPNFICSDLNNWSASINTVGGSPGIKNSIFNNTPDTTSPNLINITHATGQEILVEFDEIMNQASLAAGNYLLDNGLTVSNVILNTPYAITLALDAPMTSGTIYQLAVTGVTDCAGNVIDNNSLTYLYDVEAPVFHRFIFRDTVTIEVVYDEAVDQTSAKTISNFSINQAIGVPNSATLDPTDNTKIKLGLTKALSIGSTYSLTHQNLADTLGNTSTSINSGFTFQNEIDTVIVISSQLLDVYFDQDVDQTTAETLLNYKVDKSLDNPITAALDNGNPKLVHLVFNNSFAENSAQVITFNDIKAIDNSPLQLLNTAFIYDTDDPDIDSVVVVDGEHLHIYFNEVLDQTSAEAINNYSVNNSIGNPSFISLQSDNTSVILEFVSLL